MGPALSTPCRVCLSFVYHAKDGKDQCIMTTRNASDVVPHSLAVAEDLVECADPPPDGIPRRIPALPSSPLCLTLYQLLIYSSCWISKTNKIPFLRKLPQKHIMPINKWKTLFQNINGEYSLLITGTILHFNLIVFGKFWGEIISYIQLFHMILSNIYTKHRALSSP